MSSPLVLGPILPGDWPVSSTDPSYAGYKQAIIDSAATLLDSIQQSEDNSSSAGFNKGELLLLLPMQQPNSRAELDSQTIQHERLSNPNLHVRKCFSTRLG